MQKPIQITASILAADLGHLQEEIDALEKAGVDAIQVDVMDGHFVPNLTFGAPLLKNLKTNLSLDIHLMVVNPAERIDEFVEIGAQNITFHAEAVPNEEDQMALVKLIRSKGCTAGIAINPETHQDAIHTLDVDMILCMTVHPGFSGQGFIADVLPKIAEIRSQHSDIQIQVDGGIDEKTAPLCIAAGATNLVSASAIFKAKDRAKMIAKLRET